MDQDTAILTGALIIFSGVALNGYYSLRESKRLLSTAESGALGAAVKYLDYLNSSKEVIKLRRSVFRKKVILSVTGLFSAATLGLYLWRCERRKMEDERLAQLSEILTEIGEIEGNESVTDDEDPVHSAHEERTCAVCLGGRRRIAMVPCGHLCLCILCARRVDLTRGCVICRRPVSGTQQVFDAVNQMTTATAGNQPSHSENVLPFDGGVVCLSGIGGLLGYLYQSNRSSKLASPLDVLPVMDAKTSILNNETSNFSVSDLAKKSLSWTVTGVKCIAAPLYPSFWQRSYKTATDLIVKQPVVSLPPPSATSNRALLLAVFSFTGFVYVYATISSFARSNPCNKSNPVFLLYDYWHYQYHRCCSAFDRDNTGIALAFVTAIVFIALK